MSTPVLAATLGTHIADDLRLHGLTRVEADLVAADVDKRLGWFMALSQADRNAVAAPFMEEVANYAPSCVEWATRAAASVIVRSSLVEKYHADDLLDDNAVRSATTLAALLIDERLLGAPEVSTGHFATLKVRYPVAWAALVALHESLDTREQVTYDTPESWSPLPLPSHRRLIFPQVNETGQAIYSGIEPRFDAAFVDFLRFRHGEPLVLASMSRMSRIPEKIMHSIELALSRHMAIVTTNITIHPDGWVDARHDTLVQPDSFGDVMFMLDDVSAMAEGHRTYRQALLVA